MNVKLRVLSAGALFFIGQVAFAQATKNDSVPSKPSKEQKIEEVVVLGYSKTATKASSTAASTTISAETLENRPNTTFLNSLQGAAPGLSVNSSSGSPGSGKIDILIRGVGSLNASTDPLYVIDGLSSSSSQFRNLNPNDIETLSILKDAQATSIYGNRGANGVVVITTKFGKYNSGLKVSYDALTSFSQYPKPSYNLANAKELLKIQQIYGQGGKGVGMSDDDINNYSTDTDWTKELMRVGMTQQHNLGLTYGGENLSVFTSVGYLKNEGIIKGTDFERFTFRNNINGQSKNKRFTYSAQLAAAYSKRNQLDQEANATALAGNIAQDVLLGAVLGDPTLPKYPYRNGAEMFAAIGQNSAAYRPYVLYDNMIGGVRNLYAETSVNANLRGSYKITDNLTFTNRLGIDFKEEDRTFARSPLGYLSNSVAASTLAKYGGIEILSNFKDLTINNVSNLTFNKSFGDHDLTVAAYLDYYKGHYLSKSQTQNGLDPLLWSFGAGKGYIPFSASSPSFYQPSVSASKINAGTFAAFGTVDYDYAGRYGFSGTLRRDATYRFDDKNKWDTFWSVSGRWNIDKEEFMAESKFRMLKLRASYGTQGNQNIQVATNNQNPSYLRPLQYIDNYTSTPSIGGYQNLYGYLFSKGNADLRWEKQSMANIGLDFNYNGIVEGTFDVYQKTTDRLINNIAISAGLGNGFNIIGNNGKLENKGIEASLRGNIIRKQDIKLSVWANGAYNKNTVKALPKEDFTGNNVQAIGGPAYQWYLYQYAGVNQENGELLFVGKDGQITETPTVDDRVATGKSIFPKVSGGFGVDLDVKGFFFNAMFSYQSGGWINDNMESWLLNPAYATLGINVSKDLLNAWTPDNTNTDIPSLTANNQGQEDDSDRYLHKTDFVRLKNVAIGYNLSKEMLRNLPVRSVKVFLQAENLYTWSKWKGFDPEPITQQSLSVYPNPKVYSVGVNVEF
ncbi:TonB-dependent Receptor Plug Domain protein [Chryseobacterium sp. MOF25P]|uniref:SusC/RagA family TonB-linked outer membrane protein n=1 Tax=unclassified Chryseobacterium TaxID=2593645 RepID=UPI000805CF4E|nr:MULTISPECIES: SusC/RagA family TonB-linked outer membrane protein [unclassified Chryseobacterium]OBW40645.1 TonB-dependent Receptor Plug Domain protein [Chryseobacterium sp. MOF25P]OBW44778.1 TonB-dependent Receptor Plug Domain protein [Chryseobacterium sp. BGARF1]